MVREQGRSETPRFHSSARPEPQQSSPQSDGLPRRVCARTQAGRWDLIGTDSTTQCRGDDVHRSHIQKPYGSKPPARGLRGSLTGCPAIIPQTGKIMAVWQSSKLVLSNLNDSVVLPHSALVLFPAPIADL